MPFTDLATGDEVEAKAITLSSRQVPTVFQKHLILGIRHIRLLCRRDPLTPLFVSRKLSISPRGRLGIARFRRHISAISHL